jgi:hypothetical protein
MRSSRSGLLAALVRRAVLGGCLHGGCGVLLCLALAGCGSSAKPVVGRVDDSRQNLQKIGIAYSQAAQKLNRPPRNVDELMPFLQEGLGPVKARDVLRSPNDGQEYVIVWGVDFGQLALTRGDPYVVFAYERTGKGGKRQVLKPPVEVLLMTDSEFQKAPFPPGHQPPS